MSVEDGARDGQRPRRQTRSVAKKDFCQSEPVRHHRSPRRIDARSGDRLYIDQRVALRSKNPDKAAKTLRGILRLYLDDWKSKELGEIRRKDVLARQARLWKTMGGTTANVVVTHLHTVFEWAITRELFVGANPAKLHADDRAPGVERKRYLEPKELARVLGACEKYQQGSVNDKDLACFVLLSLATGQRKQTVMKAKWSSINLRDATWSLEASETKNGEAFHRRVESRRATRSQLPRPEIVAGVRLSRFPARQEHRPVESAQQLRERPLGEVPEGLRPVVAAF